MKAFLASVVVMGAALPAQTPGDQASTIAAKVAAIRQRIDPQQIAATIQQLVGFGTRHTESRTDSDTEGTGAARKWLQAQFQGLVEQSGGRLSVQLQAADMPGTRPELPKTIKVVNVIATLRGTTDPTRVYVIGGHYDSRNAKTGDGTQAAPGANDDGSGTAVALAACRAMVATEFPATVMFVAYDGEEAGLLGSRAHAEALAHEQTKVDGMITCDIVGNTLGMDGMRYDGWLRCFSYAPTGGDSNGRSFARAVTFAAQRHVPDLPVKLVFRGDRYGRGGDHRSFFDQGYPAVRFTEAREDYSRQHQDVTQREGAPYGDVQRYVDVAYVARVTAVVCATLAELASAPPVPLVTSARAARTAYDTELDYTLPPGVSDYEFVWRDTTAADWQGVVAKAAAVITPLKDGKLRALLPGVPLDDAVVGMRSIGADGSRSRVATPPEPDRFDARRGTAGGR